MKSNKKHNTSFIPNTMNNKPQTAINPPVSATYQLVVPHDHEENKKQVKKLEQENEELKKENEGLKQKVDQYHEELSNLSASITEYQLGNSNTKIEKLKQDNKDLKNRINLLENENEKLKQDNEDLKKRVYLLENEKKKREERIIVGEIAYSFERQVINAVFHGRQDQERYRMKFNDIFDDTFIKSADEQQKIEDFKNEWMKDGIFTQTMFISRAIKQLKTFGLLDSHGDSSFKSSITSDNVRDVLTRVFTSSNSGKDYEKEDAFALLSFLENIATDKNYPLK